ncbi:protoheme IX farnesyltransferase, mitochondrial-like [Rutidosis leptorrhynchoides]|uniref:protoheme IX farnesyltransferase, mitochondrial-like n=1 Tax=Rutidosis leptorrhynchoides TaxID=125765 RepID=UPI003A9A2B19
MVDVIGSFLKPNLVVATSGAGYVLGSGSAIDLAGLCYTCVGTMMVAADHVKSGLCRLIYWQLDSNFQILFYNAFVYTPLKQIHPVNTWVGAVVGAIPPLLGWAAASGQISLNGLILPAALYFWQIPHFMALAYLCRDDYAAGGYVNDI